MQKIGKEIKIGLAVIGVLVAAFGYILFRNSTRPDDLAAAPPAATAPATAAPRPARRTNRPSFPQPTGRPADAATDGGQSSRSLFGTPHRGQASDAADWAPSRELVHAGGEYTANTASGTASTGTATAGAASSDATFMADGRWSPGDSASFRAAGKPLLAIRPPSKSGCHQDGEFAAAKRRRCRTTAIRFPLSGTSASAGATAPRHQRPAIGPVRHRRRCR